MRSILLILCLWVSQTRSAQFQPGWKWTDEVRTTCRLVRVDEQTFYLQDIRESSRRYVAVNLPEELRQDGITLKIRAMTAPVPPHVKMLGKPAFLLRIDISKRTQKTYHLAQRVWMFRAPK